jgi:hypothetical protein
VSGIPATDDLLCAVIEWIDEVRPSLCGGQVFLARVAQSALESVRREVALRPAATARANEQLRQLLGHDGYYEDLSSELSELLRRGQMDLGTPGLLETLTSITLGQLTIDQPGYRHEGASLAPAVSTDEETGAR